MKLLQVEESLTREGSISDALAVILSNVTDSFYRLSFENSLL